LKNFHLKWFHWAILLSSLMLTFTAWYVSSSHVEERLQTKIDRQTSQVSDLIVERMQLYENALKSGVAYFEAANLNVSRSEWERYSETLNLSENYPGINGIGVIFNVGRENEVGFNAEQGKNWPGFKVYPAHDNVDLFPITYIEPAAENLKAIGLDMAHEENRYAAAKRARDTGLSRITGPITLVQDESRTPGFLLFVPFYSQAVNSQAERRDHFVGMVYAPFIFNRLIQGTLNQESRGIDIRISDQGQTLYSELDTETDVDIVRGFSLPVFGRSWDVDIRPTADFYAEYKSYKPWYILVGGLLIDAALLIFFIALSRSNARALSAANIASKKFEEEKEKLSELTNFQNLIIKELPDLIFVKDEQFRIIQANAAMLELFPEEQRDTVIGTMAVDGFNDSEVEEFLEQDRIAFAKGYAETIEKITFPTGEVKTLLTKKIRFYDNNGDKFILAIGHDITEMVKAEEKLRIANAELEQKVRDRTKDLEKQKRLAEKANKTKDDFLANMSHELRTPINSIMGLSRLIKEEEDISEGARESLEIVEASSDTLLQIVNDILDISKIESGSFELATEPFNLANVVFGIVDQIRPLASSKGLTLTSNVGDFSHINVIGDEFRFSRVVTNLLSNAVKYTDAGEVNLALNVDQNGGAYDIHMGVKDTGIGIPKDKLDTIFEKFTQVDEKNVRKYGGTGLGLNITKKIVEMMGGAIRVESIIDVGSVFTFALSMPRAPDALPVDSSESLLMVKADHTRKPINQARILVAEDHAFNQVLIKKLLASLGITTFDMVDNGEKAVEAFKTHSYDLILMDCHMPEMNGYEATKRIRELENGDTHVPILAITADAMLGTRENCLNAGMDDYISKPIDKDKFDFAVRSLFARPDVAEDASKPTEGGDDLANSRVDLTMLKDYSDGDISFEREIVDNFYQTARDSIAGLKEAVRKKDHAQWVEQSHKLKGSSGFIGAEKLSDICAKAQQLPTDTECATRNAVLQEIKVEFRLVRTCLDNLYIYAED